MKTQKLFNSIFYNKELTTKKWRIVGAETDPKQINDDENFTINDKTIDLTITKEKGYNDIFVTLNIDNKEYNFILYDEIIKYINKLNNK